MISSMIEAEQASLWWPPTATPQDWYPLFPNPVLAEGVLDRLINKAHHIIINGKSYRPRLRPDREKGHQHDVPWAESTSEAPQA